MKNFRRSLSLLLLLCILAGLVSCTGTEAEETTAALVETTEAPALDVTFQFTSDYLMVRPDEAETDEITAFKLLSRGLESACGFKLNMTTDFKKKSEPVVPNEFEILLGQTNRNESVAALESLSYYDWTYSVVSENVIVICGGSPESTITAVEHFLADLFGYKEDAEGNVISGGSYAELTVGHEVLSIGNYPVTSLKIGNRDISEYSIVDATKQGKKTYLISDGISKLCGVELPIVPVAEYKGGPAIFFGCGAPDGSHLKANDFSSTRYFITESDGNIFIDFKTDSVAATAAARFLFEYLPSSARGEYTVALSDRTFSGIHVFSGTNGLTLVSREDVEVAAGVIYTEVVYSDKDGAPVRAYAITVKKGAASIETTMPSDSAEKKGTVSNMKNQLSAAIANGKNAIAAVNADFFDMGGTNVMRGLCIKDGVFISGTGDRPWFGITLEGEPVMGIASEYTPYKDKLAHAVGASHVILRNGATDNLSNGTEFSDTRHPRTAVGVTDDGSIVLIVVDGRQPEISNGASLADLAYIMSTFGCTDAVNLDGGGSSTLILKNEKGELVTENSPSAGALRAVANGLMVVLP